MRWLALLVLAACSGKKVPTDQWCDRYVNSFNTQVRPFVAQLADPKPVVRQNAATELRLILHPPELVLAAATCADARNDTAAEANARGNAVDKARGEFVQTMLTDLGNLDTTPVSDADVADLQKRFDKITQALMGDTPSK